MLVTFVLVLLAQAKDFFNDFYIKAIALGFEENFLFALVQGLDLFLDVFDALNDGANAITGDIPLSMHQGAPRG